MATSAFKPDNRPRPLPAGINPRSFVRWGTLLRFLAFFGVGGDALKKLSTDGIDPMETAGGGMHLRVRKTDADHPFKVVASAEGDDLIVHVSGGTFNGAVIDGLDITIPGGASGTYYIVGKPSFTLSVSFDYVYSWVYDSFALDYTSSGTPENVLSTSGSDFSIPMAKIVDGVVEQYVIMDIAADLRDDGGGTGQAFMKYVG